MTLHFYTVRKRGFRRQYVANSYEEFCLARDGYERDGYKVHLDRVTGGSS